MSLFNKKIPEPTLRRLPVYLSLLRDLNDSGIPTVSAPDLARRIKQDPSQVVKDIAVTGIKGRTRVGYNIIDLIEALEEFLGFNRTNEAFLIGTGPMGKALVALQETQLYGLKIIGAFERDPNNKEKSLGNLGIHDFRYLEELIPKLHVYIAVLAVPSNQAQELANELVRFGIKAIWNFTSAILILPDHITVQNSPLIDDLSVLLHRIKNQEENDL